MGKLEVIEHTADIGIRVEAETFEELFGLAATGMFSVIVDISTVEPKVSMSLNLKAENVEELLHEWLRELLFRSSVDRTVFCDFAFEKITDTALDARVSGEPIDFEKHILHTEVKAVTRHAFKVGKVGSLWTAEVFFDI